MAMPVSVTLSSAGTASVNLDYMSGKPASVHIIPVSTSSSGDFYLSITLDDLMRTKSSQVRWCGLSSTPSIGAGPLASTAAFHYTSSNWCDNGFFTVLPYAVGGVQLGSTQVGTGHILKVMQGIGT